MNSSGLYPGEKKKGNNRPRGIVFQDNTLCSDETASTFKKAVS